MAPAELWHRVRRAPVLAAGLAWLVFLTLRALGTDWHVHAPFDQRTGHALSGASLTLPAWAGLIEPIAAPARILVGAPDFRLAIASTALWIVALGLLVPLLLPARRRSVASRLGRALHVAATMAALFVLYLLFMVVVDLPGWRLSVTEPGPLVADLHSHTVLSHDGVVTAGRSLAVHRARGYDVVAFTEHDSPELYGSGAARAARVGTPAVIHGLEIAAVTGRTTQCYLLVLGVHDYAPWLAAPPQLGSDGAITAFVAAIHAQGGAVAAMAINLTPGDVPRLVHDGIDAFEIANLGHPGLTPAIRTALVAAQQRAGVALLADSDWHGWGGLFKTWTLVRRSDRRMPAAAAVIAALRGRDGAAVTPVVAQLFGTPPAWRIVLAPWVELWRYAGELDAAQVLGWWLWGLGLLLIGAVADGALVRSGEAVLLLILGAGLTDRGVALLHLAMAGTPFAFPARVGLVALAAGLAALFWAVATARRLGAARRAARPASVTFRG